MFILSCIPPRVLQKLAWPLYDPGRGAVGVDLLAPGHGCQRKHELVGLGPRDHSSPPRLPSWPWLFGWAQFSRSRAHWYANSCTCCCPSVQAGQSVLALILGRQGSGHGHYCWHDDPVRAHVRRRSKVAAGLALVAAGAVAIVLGHELQPHGPLCQLAGRLQ